MAVAATVGGATAAVAHDTLVSSSPAEGETLTSSPAEIRLTFSDDALPISPQIVVFPEGGTPGEPREATVDGRDVHLPLTEPLDEGSYRVSWSVVSSDGHRIEGTYLFGLDTDGDGAVTPPTASAAEPTTPPATTEATDTSEATDTTEATGTSGVAVAGESGTPVALWVAGIAALAAAVAVVLLIRRRTTH